MSDGNIFVGLIILAISVGCITQASYGWLVLGVGIIIDGVISQKRRP